MLSNGDVDIARLAVLANQIKASKKKKVINESFEEIERIMRTKMRTLCSRFNIPGMQDDDIYQEALFALKEKVIPGFIEEKGQFDRFAILIIRRHLATVLKSSGQMRKRVLNNTKPLHQTYDNGDEDLSLINIIPDKKAIDVSRLAEQDEYYGRLFGKLFEKLSNTEKQIFVLYHKKYTYAEMAKLIREKNANLRMDDSKLVKRIDNALVRIKSKFREVWSKHGDKDCTPRQRTGSKKKA